MEEKYKCFGSQAFFSVWGTIIIDNNLATELEKKITDIVYYNKLLLIYILLQPTSVHFSFLRSDTKIMCILV